MSYAVLCVFFANLVMIPTMVILFILMGKKNWYWWLLVIPAFALMDLDHLILTNVPGFGVRPEAGEKILHIAHTIEFVLLEVILFFIYFKWIDPAANRGFKTWAFPERAFYSKPRSYYLAWTVRLVLIGIILHWLLDFIIYGLAQKWDYTYISLIKYFLH